MGARLKLEGKKFNKLTIVKFVEIGKHDESMWECLCDCGNKTIVVGSNIKRGKTKSCGCLVAETGRIYGIKNRKGKGEFGLSSLYYVYKKRSKELDKPLEITLEQFKELTSKICFYCNSVPKCISGPKTDKKYTEEGRQNSYYIYNGLDRIDNSKGYSLKNVLTCCKDCNKLRNNYLSVEETKQVVLLLKQLRNKENIWK